MYEYLEKYKPYLTSNQIFELLNAGHEIRSHTKSHPNCDILKESDIENEICDSIYELRKRFNTNIISFSFPFGRNEFVTNYIEKNCKSIKVILGIKEKYLSNLTNPLKWERTNMETESYFYPIKFHWEIIRNTLKRK